MSTSTSREQFENFLEKRATETSVQSTRYVSKRDWRQYFRQEALVDSCTPSCAFPPPMDSLRYIVSPFADDNKPLFIRIDLPNEFIIAECNSSTAACKTLKKLMTVDSTAIIKKELVSKRLVFMGKASYSDKSANSGYVIKGNYKYGYIQGFSNLLSSTQRDLTPADSTFKDIFNTVLNIASKIVKGAEISYRKVLSLYQPTDDGYLLDQLEADDTPYNRLMLTRAFQVIGLLNMVSINMSDPQDFNNKFHICAQLTLLNERTLLQDFFNFIDACFYITPSCNMNTLQIFGMTTCMPSQQGWGFLTHINSSSQAMTRGHSALSLGMYIQTQYLSTTTDGLIINGKPYNPAVGFMNNYMSTFKALWRRDGNYAEDFSEHDVLQLTAIQHDMRTYILWDAVDVHFNEASNKKSYDNYIMMKNHFIDEFSEMKLQTLDRKKDRLDHATQMVTIPEKKCSMMFKAQRITQASSHISAQISQRNTALQSQMQSPAPPVPEDRAALLQSRLHAMRRQQQQVPPNTSETEGEQPQDFITDSE